MKWFERIIDAILWLGLAAILALVIAVVLGGVTLTVRNESKSVIDGVTVDYVRGVAKVGTLRPGEEWSDDLGEIGEGADFLLSFQQDGAKFQENSNVYFHGLGFRTHVVLHVLEDQQIRVTEGDEHFSAPKKAVRMSDAR